MTTIRSTPQGRSKAAAKLGRLGGKARADRLSPERRKEIATIASRAAAEKRRAEKAESDPDRISLGENNP